MTDYTNPETQVKFNAGLSVSIEIAKILKNCENLARMEEFSLWFNELQILRRRLQSKERDNKKAKQEMDDKQIDKTNCIRRYKVKSMKGKKISSNLSNEVYNYLKNYENSLRYWVDKFGYGMPDAEDPTKAAWR